MAHSSNDEPDTHAAASTAKAELRATLRERRRALSPATQTASAEVVAREVESMAQWHNAHRLGLYLPTDGELSTLPIIAAARHLGKAIYLPRLLNKTEMAFAQWREDQTLQANRYGIDEPAADAPRVSVTGLEILFLPLVAWDSSGGRLGMGAGYYDRALAPRLTQERMPLIVGLAYAQQEVPRVPRERWDVPMDWVVTELGVLECRSADSQKDSR